MLQMNRSLASRSPTAHSVAVLALLAFAAIAGIAQATPAGVWSSFAPPQGGDGVGAYDPSRHRFIQFDAHHHGWVLDTTGDSTWTQLTFTGEPPRLTGASAIYDPNGDRLIVFGGIEHHEDGTTVTTARVWALDFSGTPGWTELAPVGGPPQARAYHSAGYGPRGQRRSTFRGAAPGGTA